VAGPSRASIGSGRCPKRHVHACEAAPVGTAAAIGASHAALAVQPQIDLLLRVAWSQLTSIEREAAIQTRAAFPRVGPGTKRVGALHEHPRPLLGEPRKLGLGVGLEAEVRFESHRDCPHRVPGKAGERRDEVAQLDFVPADFLEDRPHLGGHVSITAVRVRAYEPRRPGKSLRRVAGNPETHSTRVRQSTAGSCVCVLKNIRSRRNRDKCSTAMSTHSSRALSSAAQLVWDYTNSVDGDIAAEIAAMLTEVGSDEAELRNLVASLAGLAGHAVLVISAHIDANLAPEGNPERHLERLAEQRTTVLAECAAAVREFRPASVHFPPPTGTAVSIRLRERRSGLDRRLGSERRQRARGNPSERINLQLYGERRVGMIDRRRSIERRLAAGESPS
jgi:hypothetical protein